MAAQYVATSEATLLVTVIETSLIVGIAIVTSPKASKMRSLLVLGLTDETEGAVVILSLLCRGSGCMEVWC